MSRVSPIKDIREERMYVQYMNVHYPRAALYWKIGRNSGYRVSDVLNLTVYDLKEIINNGKFTIKEKKTGKLRSVALTAELKKTLVEFVKDKNDYEKVFRSRQGQNKAVSSRQMGRDLKKAAKEVGLKVNVGTHSARKTFAYYMDKARGIEFVQALLGHSTQRVTMVYTGRMEEIQDEAIMSDLPVLGV